MRRLWLLPGNEPVRLGNHVFAQLSEFGCNVRAANPHARAKARPLLRAQGLRFGRLRQLPFLPVGLATGLASLERGLFGPGRRGG